MYRYFSCLITIFMSLLCSTSHAWGLRTHLWVGQQVIDDVIDDCHVDIVLLSGQVKNYQVSDEVCSAIRANLGAFRAGNLGPDAFPDPVVGQMTTHPGVEGGWATDRWLSHVLNAANTPEDVAFAYGFISHAAADVFAHSYVNHYAGDVFVLSDGETAVELRHFALEKYIESKTPVVTHQGNAVPLSRSGISIPKRFLSTTLIYNESVAREYFKVRFGLHLSTLHVARGTVQQSAKASQAIVDGVAKLISEYYKLQADQLLGLKQTELSLEAAKLALKKAEEVLGAEDRLLNEKRKIYEAILSTIENNPALIFGLSSLIDEQLRTLADLAGQLGRLNKQLDISRSDIGRFEADLNGLIARGGCDLIKSACRNDVSKICDLPGACPALGATCCVVNEVCDWVKPQDCSRLEAQVKDATNRFNGLQNEVHAIALRVTETEARKAALVVEKTQAETALALAQAGRAAAAADLAAQEAAVQDKRKIVKELQSGVTEALRLVKEAKDALDLSKKLIGQIEDFAKRYNVVTLFFNNWIEGIDRAGDDYVEASLDATLKIMTASGNAFEPYQRWLQCSLMNYAGVPWQVPFAYCEVKDKFDEIKSEIDRLKDSLPPILQWVIDPMGELQDELLKKAKPEVWKAVEASADFVLKPPAGRFIHLLADPKLVTPEALQDSFSEHTNTQGKKLIILPNVVQMANTDMALSASGQLTAESFNALRNSVLLAKLSLLGAAQLNMIFRDLAGDVSTRYGPTLYDEGRGGRFTLLLDAVRSIDGNHQWQPFGLPYPRSDGAPEPASPDLRRFGHSVHDHPHLGLRLFADPVARKEVFHRIFSGPIEGSLLDIPQLKFPPYTHPACARNPFPRSVDDNGSAESHDLGCVSNANPAKWFDSLGELIERFVYWLKSANQVPTQR